MTLWHLLFFISDDNKIDSGNTDHLSLLNQLPLSLWAKSPTDVGKIHSTPPIKIKIDPSKPLLRINQYPISKEPHEGIEPIIEAYKAQGLIIPCSSPCNTPILPVRKPKGWGWRFVQDLPAINYTVIPWHPVVPNPHTLLTYIPTRSKFFTIIDLCSAFFSVPVDEASQYLFAFTGEEKQFTWTVTPQGFTESPYFWQILKADLDDMNFLRGSTSLHYVDDLLLYSPSPVSSQEDTIHLLKLLALKVHKAPEKNYSLPSLIFRTSHFRTRVTPRSS